MTATRPRSRSPGSCRAGIVTPTPKAMDSPAEPTVWTMLFSRIVVCRAPVNLEKRRKRVMERTAIGIEADTGHADFQHEVERRGPEDDAQGARPR